MHRLWIAFLLCFVQTPFAAAFTSGVFASTDCQITMIVSTRCGGRATTVAGREIESSLALHEVYQDTQFPYGETGHTSSVLAQARAREGNLGVYTLGNTVAFANGMGGGSDAWASSRAEYSDAVPVPQKLDGSAGPVELVFGISISRDLTIRSLSTSGYAGTTALLDARMVVSVANADFSDIRQVAAFHAVACAPVPCSGSAINIDPSGTDSFSWAVQANPGDYLILQGFLLAESDGKFGSVVAGSHNGVGTATVNSYNSTHTFIRVAGADAPLQGISGATYLTTAVPEPATILLWLLGLTLAAMLGVARPGRPLAINYEQAPTRSCP